MYAASPLNIAPDISSSITLLNRAGTRWRTGDGKGNTNG
jgi:hypothetical protein